ncbi:hypothetical protein WA158_004493 [Blastocystis sp. Blastoise]
MYGVCNSGYCHCNSGYVCSHCTHTVQQIVSGQTCPCDRLKCGDHGTCQNGKCVCKDGYLGLYCETNPCSLADCGSHGTCDPEDNFKCICHNGWYGDHCELQTTGGYECTVNEECNGGVGGICNKATRRCECYEGWTCPQCSNVGKQCDDAARLNGGDTCSKNADCGNFGPNYRKPTKTGGSCLNGRCVCYEGYACPDCSVIGNAKDLVAMGYKCPGDGIQSNPYILSIFLISLSVLFYIYF